MRTDSQAAPESGPSVPGAGRSRASSLTWRLPVAYRAIPATAVIPGGKLAVMEECGIKVTKNPAKMGELLKSVL